MYPDYINQLITSLKRFQGVGQRSAERMALNIINWTPEFLNHFIEQLQRLKTDLRFCEKCNGFSDDKLCKICNNTNRNHRIICVVETPPQVMIFEQNGGYNGIYFVFGSKLKPLDGIGIEQTNWQKLEQIIDNGNVDEIILALGSDVEGIATSSFIANALGNKVIVSSLATGIPLGADISYADSATISAALNRRYRL